MSKQFLAGEKIGHTFEVRSADMASFHGGNVHQVCSTFALAREIEWCSRKFVIREKDEGEEGIGTQLIIHHKSPAFLGSKVEIMAEVVSYTNNELLCKFEARVSDRLIAHGSTGQKILPQSRIKEIFSTFEQQ